MTTIFISSTAFVNPLWAKPVNSMGKTDSIKSSGKDSTVNTAFSFTSNKANNDYDRFQKCLSDSASTKGFATNQEIKDCYNPIYRPLSTTTTPFTLSTELSRPHVGNTHSGSSK